MREEQERQKRIAEREKKQEEDARKRRQVRADDVTHVGWLVMILIDCVVCRSESACAMSGVAITVAAGRLDEDRAARQLNRRGAALERHVSTVDAFVVIASFVASWRF